MILIHFRGFFNLNLFVVNQRNNVLFYLMHIRLQVVELKFLRYSFLLFPNSSLNYLLLYYAHPYFQLFSYFVTFKKMGELVFTLIFAIPQELQRPRYAKKSKIIRYKYFIICPPCLEIFLNKKSNYHFSMPLLVFIDLRRGGGQGKDLQFALVPESDVRL